MDKCDFTFRGEALSDYGYVLCTFSQSTISPVTTDSQRTFTSISMFGGKRFPFLFTKYDNAMVVQLSICKDPDADSPTITPSEAATIKRWLSSPTPQEFTFHNTYDYEYDGIRWYGSFNVEEVHFYGDCVGFNLTFTSTAPFGYYNDVTYSGTVSAGGSIAINDISDEEGYIYPDMVITLNEAGNLIITNDTDGRTTVVNNCTNGEELLFSHLLQISSSRSSHSLGNDFNYRFLRINNTYENTINNISFNLSCDYTITYQPIAKVVIS